MDLRLLEDCGKRRGALGSEAVVRDAVSEGQDGNGERVGVSMGADRKANACGAACALERRERRRRGQQLAQHDRSRLTDALVLQVKLRDAVLAQGGERDPAEVGHTGVLEHHRGQTLRSVARDAVVADAVTPGHRAMV